MMSFRVSDIIALAGVSIFDTPISTARRIIEGKEKYISKAMEEGLRAEEMLYEMLRKTNRFSYLRWADPIECDTPYCKLRGAPDAIGIFGERYAVIDFKLTHYDWHEPPEMYVWQVSLYAYIYNKLGLPMSIGALYTFSPKGFFLHLVDLYSESECEALIKSGVEFFEKFLADPIEADEISRGIMDEKFGELALKAKKLSKEIAEKEKELESIKNILKEKLPLGKHEYEKAGEKVKVNITENARKYLDTKRLEEIMEVPEELYKITIYKTITIS